MNRKTCIYRIFNSSIRSQTQLTRRAEALVLPRLGRATDGEVALLSGRAAVPFGRGFRSWKLLWYVTGGCRSDLWEVLNCIEKKMYNHYHIQLFYWLSPHSTSLLYYSPLFTTLRHSTLQYNITFIHNLPHSTILSCSVTLLHLAALTHSPSMSHFSVLLHCELRALPQLQHTTTLHSALHTPQHTSHPTSLQHTSALFTNGPE